MIKINDDIYDAQVTIGLDGSMTIGMISTDTLEELDEKFAPGTAPVIEIIEGNRTTAIYYNKEIYSLMRDANSYVNIALKVSHATDETIDNIQTDAELSAEAIEELAMMAADHEERIVELETALAALTAAEEVE